MKLIIGIGNPGEKYRNNRHNVGYMFVDLLEKLPSGIVAKKTNIFMNDSGEAVKRLITNYKLQITNLYIVHDDLDLPLGKHKIQFGKGPKIHNGINDIERVLGTSDFWRVRVGVDNRGKVEKVDGVEMVEKVRPQGKDYVLQDFTQEEEKILKNIMPKIVSDLISQLM